MSLTQLLQWRILLQKCASRTALWISEDETRLVQNCNLIVLLELSPLVPSYYAFVDKCAVAREVLENCNCVGAFVFGK